MSVIVILLGLLARGLARLRARRLARARAGPHERSADCIRAPATTAPTSPSGPLLPALVVTLAVGRGRAGRHPPLGRRDAAAERATACLRPSSRSPSAASRRWRRACPTLSREDYEIVKRVRYGFTAPDDALRILQERGVALGSAPEPYVITAAYDQVDVRAPRAAAHHRRRRRARAARLALSGLRASARSCAPATRSSGSCSSASCCRRRSRS